MPRSPAAPARPSARSTSSTLRRHRPALGRLQSCLDQLDPAGLDVAGKMQAPWPTPSCSMNRAWPARRIGTRAKALIAGLILHIVATEPRDRRNPRHPARISDTLAPEASALLKDMTGVNRRRRPDRPRRKPPPRQIRPGGGRRPLGRAAPYPFPRQPAHGRGPRPIRFPLCRSQAPQRDGVPRPAARSPLHLFPMAAPARRAKPHRHGPRSAKPAVPVLYLLDEFAALGHLAPSARQWALIWLRRPALAHPAGRSPAPRHLLGSAPEPSCQTPASYRCSASTITTAPASSPICSGRETVVFQTMSQALDSTNPAFPTASSTFRPARC